MAAAATAVPLILSLCLWVMYDYEEGQFQWVEQTSWIGAFNIEYHVGVDGLSLPLIFLTAMLQFIAVFSSWKEMYFLFCITDRCMPQHGPQ